MNKNISIGMLSRETGVKAPTIRYYESIGLLSAAPRTPSNRRVYDADAGARLRFVRHARQLGFEVATIRQLLQLSDHPEQPCDGVDAIARQHLSEIEGKIASLVALRMEIQRMVRECKQGRIGECLVMDMLSHHENCLHDSH